MLKLLFPVACQLALGAEARPADTRGRNNYGMWNGFYSPMMQNNLIGACDGTNDDIHNTTTTDAYIVNINNSQIAGDTCTICQNSNCTTQVGASQLTRGGAFVGAYLRAAYNGNFNAFDSTCH